MNSNYDYTTPKKITYSELMQMMADIDLPDSAIRPYLRESVEHSHAFHPEIEVDWSLVIDDRPEDEVELEGAVAVSALNGLSRARRRRRYKRKIRNGWSGIKIVSEGDSWFQYPWLLDDVIDHLSDEPDMAVRSLGAAGDLLKDMVDNSEYVDEIRRENPRVFLISGGGNDLVNNGRLATMLHPFDSSRDPEDYPNDAFRAFEQEIETTYKHLFTSLGSQFPQLKILCHGYDYAIPNHGKWLGRPMESIGITDTAIQKEILKVVMDRFNTIMQTTTAAFPSVSFIDARTLVKNWHDELHPRNDDYAEVAEKFADQIRAVA